MNKNKDPLLKKKIINITLISLGAIALVALIIFLLTWKPDKHTHSFNTSYSYNETHHWRSATCDHVELMEDYGEHVFNDLMLCNQCNYQSSLDPNKPVEDELVIDFDYTNSNILLTKDDQEIKIGVGYDTVHVETSTLEQSIEFFEDYYELTFINASGNHTVKVDSQLTALGYVNAQYTEIASLAKALQGLSSRMTYDAATGIATLPESNTLSLVLDVHYPSISGTIMFEDNKVTFIDISFTVYVAGEPTKGNVKVSWNEDKPVIPNPEVSSDLIYDFITTGPYAGTYRITGMRKELTDVVIPAEINGVAVTTISDRAFRNTDIQSVVVPGSVKVIGRSAFENCSKLTLITLENGVEVIKTRAFARINPHYTIHMYDSIVEFGKDAFLPMSNYKSNGAWYYYGDINKYAMSTFGDSNATPATTHTTYFNKEEVLAIHLLTAEYISDYAFRGFDEVVEYRIGTSVKKIGTLAIDGRTIVGSGSTEQILPYNILYNGTLEDWLKIEFTKWWAMGYGYNLYCNNEKVIFANLQNITEVPAYAFAFCRSLSSIELGSKVTTIREGAFQYCSIVSFEATANLTVVEPTAFTIDDSMYNIDSSAFRDYNGAYYIGTHDNPYFICFEVHNPDDFALAQDCVIFVQQ